jgi:hypothetical protein
MRLGSTDDDDYDNDDTGRRRRMGSSNNNDGIFSNTAEGNRNKKYVVLGIIGLLLFFMIKSALSTSYEDKTKEYYKSIGRDDVAHKMYSKKDLEDEKLQLIQRSKENEIKITEQHKMIEELSARVKALENKHHG